MKILGRMLVGIVVIATMPVWIPIFIIGLILWVIGDTTCEFIKLLTKEYK